MKITEFSVKHSLFVNLITVFIIICGIFLIFTLRKEAFPPVDFNAVIITTYFRGASPEKVEKLVNIPLERELKKVSDIRNIYSSAYESIGTITLEVEEDVRDMQKVVNDVQKAVDRVTDLPADVEDRPVVIEIDSSEIPILKIAVSGNRDEFTLRRNADLLKEMIEDIPGIASVQRDGWRDEEYRIEPDPEKMSEYHISFEEIAERVKAQNVDLPGGKITSRGKDTLIKVKAEFSTIEQLENTVIRANDLGNWIRVKDIGRVFHTFEDESVLNKAQGSRAITLIAVKKENSDILKTVNQVFKKIEAFKPHADKKIQVSTFYDISYYVKRRLNVLRSNGIIGFFFVITVLFLFLPPVSAMMTALGIPIALFTTLMVMHFTGLTINLITMFGLIMVLGIVVDDGIIISENTYRYLEKGISPPQAAIKGTDEVSRPVIATVLTTIVAFSPLMFMSGMVGKFVRYIPVVVIIALSASVLEAFIILPSHLADFARPLKKRHGRSQSHWFQSLLSRYKKFLTFAIEHRYKILFSVISIFIFSLVMARFFMPFILFSSQGVEQFVIRLESRPDTSIYKTNEFISQAENLVKKLPAEYLEAYETQVGILELERGFDPDLKRGGNFAQITVYLTPSGQRDKTAQEIIELMRPDMEELAEKLKPQGVNKLYFQEFREGPPVGRAIDVRIRGENMETLRAITNQIKNYLSSIPGISGIADSYTLGPKEIDVYINEEKAQKAYLSNSQIAFAVRAAFAGAVSTTIKQEKAEEEISVVVRLSEDLSKDPEIFNNILVRNSRDNLIPLSEVVSFRHSQSIRSINHLNGKRYLSVTADVDEKNITSLKANTLIWEKFGNIDRQYPGYSLSFGGEQEETRKSIQSLLIAFAAAISLIFLILATQFNSLLQPFVVMLTIPFGIIGFIIAFFIHAEPLSFLGIMGFVGLTGVVVNDSIVLVDFINKRREDLPIKEAVVEGGSLRLRPILLTTITTVCGLFTVAYGLGGLDPFLRPMALAISWGLLFATILTLIVIPCVYLIIEDIHNWRQRNSRKS